MQYIRCTAKLQKEMGLKKSDLNDGESEPSPLGQWHANLIYIDRRKCILFVNDQTLFNFILTDVPRSEIRKLAHNFKFTLSCVLHAEGLSTDRVEKALNEYSEIEYGKSNDRSVLGNLNDLAYNYEVHILEAGGVHSPEVPSIIKKQNRMPMNKKAGYIFPAAEIMKVL